LAQGLSDLYYGRLAEAEQSFRKVLAANADSASRAKAYVGLEAVLMSQERYASLESLELRAAREGLEYDSTNRFAAQVLSRLGPMGVEAASTGLNWPMKLSSTGTPVIRARANGRAPDDFWLDTGASISGVTESFARKHGVRILGAPVGLAGTSTQRKVPVRMGVLDSLQVGPLTLRNVPVMVLRDQDLSFKLLFITLLKIDAIIGWPVISRFITTLDYPGRELTLMPAGAQRDGSDVRSAHLFFAGQPFITVAVDSTYPLNFILDTGASVSMITPAGLEKLPGHPAPAQGLGCIGGAGGGDAGRVRMLRGARLAVAGQELSPQALTVHEFPGEGLAFTPQGILGADVLLNFKVVIDPWNGMLTLIR
jgi:hypothetical protein